jgi:hypothetical protein
MYTPLTLIVLCACAAGLAACDKAPTIVPTPTVYAPAPTGSGAVAGSTAGLSVPSAESVLPSTNAVKAEPAQGRSNTSMSAAQESTAMPMPGQNNDHSAPMVPARPASSP